MNRRQIPVIVHVVTKLFNFFRHKVSANERTGFSAGSYLVGSNDCKSCHMIDKTSVGPSFVDIASRYKDDSKAVPKLAEKVISGGSGVWGEHVMAAHPNLSRIDAERMVKHILNASRTQPLEKPLPLKGDYITKIPEGENGKGGYLLRAV